MSEISRRNILQGVALLAAGSAASQARDDDNGPSRKLILAYVRTYTPKSEAVTEIVEEVRFELLPNTNIDEASAVARMSAHMLEVQPHIKNHVEARARTAQQGR